MKKSEIFAKTARQLSMNGFVMAAGAALFLLFTTPARAAGTQVLHGHVPMAVARLQPMGQFPGTNQLTLAIGLPLRNREALTNLLGQIYNPASPNFHHYLTPEQFTERFGPTEQDYQAVIAFAKANGLRVTGTHLNRVLLDVSGTVANIEKTLHVTMRVYQHPKENRTFYAPDAEPSLNLTVPVLDISGLNNYSLPRPRLKVTPLAKGQNPTSNAGSGPGGTFMGNDFRAAYVPGASLNGLGQTVGLLQFDGYTASDITYYESLAGLPSVTLTNVLLDGFNGIPTGYGEIEVSLDIEMAISMAPGLSMVIVYEAGPYGNWHDILNRMATDNLAKQLSCSWYILGGAADAVADGIFQQMAAQGQSFFNASGDDDAYTGLIDFPGDTPYITQVGGTTLTTSGPGGSWVSEKVWNWGGGTGSGGGISTQYPIPSWQTNVSMAANQGSTAMRNTPDVALTADQVYVRADGSDNNVGGTSCAAPLWAGFTALVNQQAAASGRPPVGFINPAVYVIGLGSGYTSAFHDITTGDNTSPSSPTRFYAVPGYDLATGWGTPSGQSLINALANPDALSITPLDGFSSSGGVGGPFTITSQSLSLTNTGTNSFSWSLVNTSLWLNVSPSGGTLTPSGASTTVTASLNAVASNLVVGTYGATVLFTNLNSNFVQSRQFTLSIINPPTITLQPSNQTVLDGAPATFTVGISGGLPLYYQWQANSNNLTDGTRISGSATSTLVISNVSPADVANYRVIVTNAAGATVSTNALLTALPGNVDHFSWSTISSPQVFNAPFTASITARDPAEVTATNFTGTVALAGWTPNGTNAPSIVIAEVDTSDSDAIEFANVSGRAVDVSGWQITTYDWNSWPGPGLTFTVPSGTICPAGGVFLLREMGIAPGSYPVFYTGVNIYWNNDSSGNPVALLLCDNTGQIMDFFCAVDANPASITLPTNIPPAQWLGAPVPANLNATLTYQRVGNQDRNTNADWVVGTSSLGLLNPNLNIPFVGGPTPAAITPTNSDNFVNGVWSGNITVLQTASNVVLTANDDAGHYGSSNPFSVIYSNQPPIIMLQPTNQTLPVGFNATFTLAAAGSPPLSYFWARNEAFIPGATNASYTTNNLQLSDSGSQFSCLVSNAYGTTNSQVATLTVLALPPSITQQPTNQTVPVGGTAGFSVSATGSLPLSYYWMRNGTAIAGATNSSYTTNNVQLTDSGNQFSCLVSNAYGTMLSSNAVLTVVTLPTDWFTELFGTSITNLAFNTYTFTPNGSANFYAVCSQPVATFPTDPTGGTALSLSDDSYSQITLSGGSTVAIYNNRTNVIYIGSNGYLTMNAGDTSYLPTYAYHFTLPRVSAVYRDLNPGAGGTVTWKQLSDRIAVSYQAVPIFGSSTQTNSFQVEMFFDGRIRLTYLNLNTPTGLVGLSAGTGQPTNFVASDFTTYGVCGPQPPVIVAQPGNQAVYVGFTANFSVTAIGSLPMNYQWNCNGTNLNGATNTTLTLTNVQLSQAGNYAVLVTNLYGSVLSSNAVLTVNLPPPCAPVPSGLVGWWPGEGNANDVAGTNNGSPQNITYMNGEVGQAFVFNGSSTIIRVPASSSLNVGLGGGLTTEVWINPLDVSFQSICEWNQNGQIGAHLELNEYNADGSLWGNIIDTSANAHEISTVGGVITTNRWQHVAMTYDKASGVAVLYRNGVMVATTNLGVFTPQTSFDFYMGSRPSGPFAGIYFNGEMDESSVYNRALTASEIEAIYAAGAGGKCPLTSPVIISQPTNQTVTVGGTATFNVTASGTPPLSYQWNFNGTNIVGATNTTLTLTNVQVSQAGNYAVLVTNLFGSILSSNAVLTVTLDHFAWNPILSPRFVNTPFSVVIRAQDMTNGLFTNFTGIAILGTTNGVTVTPPVSGNFIQGVWTGAVVVSQAASNLVLRANDGLGHFGLANPINVINLPSLGMLRMGNVALYVWPVGYSGFVLESSDNLSPATWVTVPYSPIQIGDQYLLPLDMTGTNGFYRLQFPGP
jgi:hypothetical protein